MGLLRKVLVTGATGQIGTELVSRLKNSGSYEVVETSSKEFDIRDKVKLEELVSKHRPDEVYHLAALLSAKSEENPAEAWEVNMDGLRWVLDLAVEYKFRIFWPSSIAAFGPDSPKEPEQIVVQNPNKMYGITKMAGELLCRYYFEKYGVDVRSIRLPGIVSWKTHPGGGTTDYAVAMFYAAVKDEVYKCYLNPNTPLPMLYIDDAVEAILKLMRCDEASLTVRTSYNIHGFTLTPKILAEEINKLATLRVEYDIDPVRQAIADTWPDRLVDDRARSDWGYDSKIGLDEMVKIMLGALKDHV